MSSSTEDLVAQVGEKALADGRTVAVAESLTGGSVASALAAGSEASSWFRGGLVAYADEVKFDLLEVPGDRVITEVCARQMASRVADLLGADVTVALTGAGGPDPVEGEPAGTVFLATFAKGETAVERLDLDGPPEDVVTQSVEHALRGLLAVLTA